MDHSKNSSSSTTNLAILSILLASIFFIFCSLNPLTNTFLSSLKTSPNNYTLSIQKDELEIALEKASMANKTVFIAIINKAYVEPHEKEYPTMFDLFLEGFWIGEKTRELVGNLLVVAMDEVAYHRCIFRRLNCYKMPGSGGDKYSDEKVYMSREFIEMMWRRTLFLLNVLKRGYSFIFTDADVLWLRNPFTKLEKNEIFDIQMSTDVFNGNSSSEGNLINTGFYLIRSNNRTIALFQTWYDERNNSTGMKEQDVLKNLVRHGVLRKLGVKAMFLDTNYFSGFCTDSRDVRVVVTVHANCCRTIGAKVVDLKAVLRDWKMFKSFDQKLDGNVGNSSFQWSKHVACISSWPNKTMS